jgi:3-oxoacyl-[acyl-carrier protein] reductase
MVERVVKVFGKLDIFVANAGIWPPEQVGVAEMSDEQWSATVAVNLNSVFFGCRAAMQGMLGKRGVTSDRPILGPSGGGSIVIVSSTASQRGEAFHADYAATKGAVNAFVKSLGVEAAPYGINVNAVAPGWVDTEMCDIPFGREKGIGKREIEEGIPLGRVASPEDIAGPIVFLCSDLARHIAGEVLNVNGGAVLCG